jgi:hypothetical protein
MAVVYMNTCVQLLGNVAEFFLEREMFGAKAVDKIKKTHFMSNIYNICFKSCRLLHKVEKCCTAGQTT